MRHAIVTEVAEPRKAVHPAYRNFCVLAQVADLLGRLLVVVVQDPWDENHLW